MAEPSPNRNSLTPFIENLSKVFRGDSWQNAITGLGMALRDKMKSMEFAGTARISPDVLEALYHEDDLVALLCDTISEEMLRNGFDVKIQSDEPSDVVLEQEEEIGTAIEELEVIPKFIEAMVWARLYGGAAIIPVLDDGSDKEDLAEPLNEDQIREIESLNVIEGRYMTPVRWYDDPAEKNYGRPSTFQVSPPGIGTSGGMTREIHESRMILFDGTRVSMNRRLRNRGFSDSVVQRSYETIKSFATGWQSVGHLMSDSNQAVFSIEGLIDMIASEDSDLITRRMQVVDMGRSVARAIAIDADKEKFERHTTNFSNLDKILQMFVLRLSSAFRMPATVTMGQSPAGENATGDADFRWFYDKTATSQTHYLKPKLRRLIKLLLVSKEGPTDGEEPSKWTITFRPLWRMTPSEEAEMRNKQADTDVKYIQEGVLLPEEVTLSRFPADGYSTETSVDLELRTEKLEIEKELELEKLSNPDPAPAPPPPTEPATE